MGLFDAIGNVASGVLGASGQAKASRAAAEASRYGTDVNAALARENAEARRRAYEEIVGRGQYQLGQGESAFEQEAAAAPEELTMLKEDILAGNTESLQQGKEELATALAQQGVRGGQAATQLRRGVGEMATGAQRDINQLMGQEAMDRQAQRLAYQKSKALGGQAATLAGY